MASPFSRSSFLARAGTSTGIGALALITGACADRAPTDSDQLAGATSADSAASAPASAEAVEDSDTVETTTPEVEEAADKDSQTRLK